MKKFWTNWALREVERGHEPKDFWYKLIHYLLITISLAGIVILILWLSSVIQKML